MNVKKIRFTIVKSGKCPKCGINWVEIVGACPECGYEGPLIPDH